jgi:hypothetical protein
MLDRVLLLVAGLLAAYQVSAGLEGRAMPAIWAYTIGFGTLLVACLLLVILGFEGLESQAVVIVSTLIPLGISTGLVAEHLARLWQPYLAFCLIGFILIFATRFALSGRAATIALAAVHGIAGLTITILPVYLVLQQGHSAGALLVSLGGGLIGLGGLLLAFIRTGRPLLPEKTIYSLLPLLLFLMTASFVTGFWFV